MNILIVIIFFLQEKAQKERWAKLPPLKKYFYKEDSKVANMTKEEVEEFRRSNNNIEAKLMFDNDVEVEGLKVPNPVTTFEQAFQVSNKSFFNSQNF